MEKEVVRTIRANQITVIAGSTGCGKVRNVWLKNRRYDGNLWPISRNGLDNTSPSTGAWQLDPEQWGSFGKYHCHSTTPNLCNWSVGTYCPRKMRESWRNVWIFYQAREKDVVENTLTAVYNWRSSEKVAVWSRLGFGVSYICWRGRCSLIKKRFFFLQFDSLSPSIVPLGSWTWLEYGLLDYYSERLVGSPKRVEAYLDECDAECRLVLKIFRWLPCCFHTRPRFSGGRELAGRYLGDDRVQNRRGQWLCIENKRHETQNIQVRSSKTIFSKIRQGNHS